MFKMLTVTIIYITYVLQNFTYSNIYTMFNFHRKCYKSLFKT